MNIDINNPLKEHNMTTNAIAMNNSLEEIQRGINTLMHATWIADLVEENDIQSRLMQMSGAACELQAALSKPAIVEGYRRDAISQVFRLGELISELNLDPDHRQLLSVGMAAELAVEKVRDFKAILSFSAKARMLNGPETAVEEAA